MSELYNQEFKDKFMNEVYADTKGNQYNVYFLFKKISKYEKNDNMDISEFTRGDIRDVLEEIKPFSLGDAQRKVKYLEDYITWMLRNGYSKRKNNISPLAGVDEAFYKSTLDNNRKLYYSYDEFQDILEETPNAQDQAMLALMFQGIIGEEFNELTHLSYYDIDWNNAIITINNREDKLTDSVITVTREVNDRVLYYLERGHHATEYYRSNDKYGKAQILVPSDLILKNTTSARLKEGASVSPSAIYGRISRLKDFLDLEYFTSKTVMQSGMLYMAYDLIFNQKKYTNLSTELYQEIGAYYNYSTMRQQNGDVQYNRNFMAKFINPENLLNLYGVEVTESKARL